MAPVRVRLVVVSMTPLSTATGVAVDLVGGGDVPGAGWRKIPPVADGIIDACFPRAVAG